MVGVKIPRVGVKITWGILTPGGQAAQGVKINCYTGPPPPPPPPPPPLAWTLGSGIMKWKLTLPGTYGQVLMLYDIWLSIYRLLKNITAEILYYGQVLDFDLWHGPLGQLSWIES